MSPFTSQGGMQLMKWGVVHAPFSRTSDKIPVLDLNRVQRLVRAPDLKSVGRGVKSRSDR